MSFYFSLDFPPHILEWFNKQSNKQLLFEYALDLAHQQYPNDDILDVLPENYQIGRTEIPTNIVQRKEAKTTKEQVKSNEEEIINMEEELSIDEPAITPDKQAFETISDNEVKEEVKKEVTKSAWGGLENLNESDYM